MISIKVLGRIASKICDLILQDKSIQIKIGVDLSIMKHILNLSQYMTEETVPIMLDTCTNLLKMSQEYSLTLAYEGQKYFLDLFVLFHGDPVLGKNLSALIKLLCQNSESMRTIYFAFEPFILDCVTVFNQQLEGSGRAAFIREPDLRLITSIFDLFSLFILASSTSELLQSMVQLIP